MNPPNPTTIANEVAACGSAAGMELTLQGPPVKCAASAKHVHPLVPLGMKARWQKLTRGHRGPGR